MVGTGAIEAGPVSNTSCSSRCVAASGSTVDGDVVTPDATATADACRCQPDCLSDGSCCSDFVAVCLGGSGKRILQSIHDCWRIIKRKPRAMRTNIPNNIRYGQLISYKKLSKRWPNSKDESTRWHSDAITAYYSRNSQFEAIRMKSWCRKSRGTFINGRSRLRRRLFQRFR